MWCTNQSVKMCCTGIIWPRGSRQYYEGDYYDLLRRGECFDEYGLVDEAYCFLTFRLISNFSTVIKLITVALMSFNFD